MSRISRLRSMTLTLSRLSRLFCWAGLSSSSATRRSNPVSRPRLRQLLGLALAHVPVRVDVAAVLPLRAHDVGARRGRQGGELGQAVLGGPARRRRRCRRRRGTPSRRAGRGRSGLARAHGAEGYPVARVDATPASAARPPSGRRSRRSGRRRRATSSSGSRRNQVRWRLRERDVAPGVLRRSPRRRVALAVEHGPGLAVADRRERRQRRVVPLAQGPRLVDQAGVELRAGAARDPPRVLGRARRRRPSQTTRRRVAARRRAAARRPERRRSRGPGRPAADCAGPCARRAPGAIAGEPRRERLEAVALEVAPRSPPGPPGRTAARRCRGRAATARRQNPVPPARIADPAALAEARRAPRARAPGSRPR